MGNNKNISVSLIPTEKTTRQISQICLPFSTVSHKVYERHEVKRSPSSFRSPYNSFIVHAHSYMQNVHSCVQHMPSLDVDATGIAGMLAFR